MKRIMLFLGTNILVMITISIIVSLLGVNQYLTKYGIDYQKLALFCLVWGMAGAFISLLMSKFMAKMAMGVVVIDPKRPSAGYESDLLHTVYDLARKAGISKMPEVGVYESPEVNAFATGPSKNNSLVAVSSGLMQSMNRDEIEGVLAHEISHIANGDMVTMTLLQGVVNAFAMFLSRIIAYAISMAMNRNEENESSAVSGWLFPVLTIVFDIVFTILGSILVRAFSRWREYHADAGGAKLTGKQKMILALERLQKQMAVVDVEHQAPQLDTLKISHPSSSSFWAELFATHPTLEKRIQRLQASQF